MKTFLPREVDLKNNRAWYLIDAENIAPGRIAATAATILRGKHKPTFTAHLDTGDGVIVINAEKINLTGNKSLGKIYYRHSGQLGELKKETAGRMLEKTPEKVIFLAVKRMLSNNKLRDEMLKRLKIFKGAEHDHEAQKPQKITVDIFSVKKS